MELKKGFIKVLNGCKIGKEIDFLYYPPEYSMDKSNTFSETSIPGLESPYLQFVKGNAGTVTLEAFYDTYEKGEDVRTLTDPLTNLLQIDPVLHAPPPLLFTWGLHAKEPFFCVLEKATRRFTLFNSDGIPVRARINITLKEFKPGLTIRERERQSPEKSKIHTVRQGDSLWSLSYREYGNPSLWRSIADRNRIEDPRCIEPGTELIIPPME